MIANVATLAIAASVQPYGGMSVPWEADRLGVSSRGVRRHAGGGYRR